MSTIAKRIKLLRESRGWTGEALAERAAIRPSTISLLENEERRDPHISTLSSIAQALGTTTDYLAGLSDCPTVEQCKPGEGNGELQLILTSWPFLAEEGQHVLAEMAQLLAQRRRQLLGVPPADK